jgi:hypothetical protein
VLEEKQKNDDDIDGDMDDDAARMSSEVLI